MPMKYPTKQAFVYHLSPLSRALAVAGLILLIPALALGQDVKGGVYGIVEKVDAAQGTLIVQNVNTNALQKRKLASDGRYKIDGLTPGSYRVELVIRGAIVSIRMVDVRAGGSTPVPELSRATDLGAVKVTANRINASADNTAPIDVSTPMLVHNYSSELLRKTGVDTSLSSVGGSYANVLTSLPSKFMSQVNNGEGSGLAGFNGGSGTESRYYIDEFDTTYDYTGAGANAVPGEAIGNATIIANGASAKYSNAMGGSISGYVKQGDNKWRGGLAEYYVPPTSKWFNQKNRTYALNNGTYYIDDSSTNGHTQSSFNTTAWLSGPIIKDRLFFYAVMQTNAPRSVASYTYNDNMESDTGNYSKFSNKTSWPLLNLTWNISSNQQIDIMGSRFRANNETSIYTLSAPHVTEPRQYVDNINWRGQDKLLLSHYRWDINDDMSLQVMGAILHISSRTYGQTPAPMRAK
ncbi:carboxypeptidase regulatory-like domain-containing protein [Rhodanobacter glycinis]|uniref:Carboxypeptidase regulatory-like domain-containing protein n=1 Tax=Rhodanobacter glycinis TaxID=582702 RepID=A0A5B9DWL0_9GAMM|nr:carboxypeptidase-like regulatory domain-containing protein [Rhodanobacter glycinis]QEE24413.1 carboxypeptidase regulatory-like domain-containing protein [Rhodanobacter glycinis]